MKKIQLQNAVIRRLWFKFKKLSERLERAIAEGRFQKLSRYKRFQLLRRLRRYGLRLQKVGIALGLGTVLSLAIGLNEAKAQTFTFIGTSGDVDANNDPASPTVFHDPYITLPLPIGSGSQEWIFFGDLNGDGAPDFVHHDSGNDSDTYFQNTGTSTNPSFGSGVNVPFGLPNNFIIPDYNFVDLDGDNDLDVAFAHRDATAARWHRNDGDVNNPSFVNAGNIPGMNFTTTNGSFLSFADMDGDNDLDAIGVSWNHNFFYFQNNGDVNTPTYSRQTNPFGFSAEVGKQISIDIVDIDGDGDNDVFLGWANNIKYYENTGDAMNPAFGSGVFHPFGLYSINTSTNGQKLEFVDIDNDNDLDLYIGVNESGHARFFKNVGTSTAPAFFQGPVDPGEKSGPAFTDIDFDGDLDMFIGAGNGIHYFKNNGTATIPLFNEHNLNPFNLTDVGDHFSHRPVFVDIDNDGDQDMFIGETDGNTYYFQNDGTPTSPSFAVAQSNPFNLVDIGANSSPTFADLDGDGDLDAMIGDVVGASPGTGNFHYFQNTGDINTPSFGAKQTNPFNLSTNSGPAYPVFIDVDGDGDLDLFTGKKDSFDLQISFYPNNGTEFAPNFGSAQTNPFGFFNLSSPNALSAAVGLTFADIDGDGDLDAFVPRGEGDVYYFRNDSSFPEINLVGNGMNIFDGDSDPIGGDGTDFGAVANGGTQENTFTIQSLGNANLELDATPITFSGTHASDFSVTQAPTSPITPTNSTEFKITFSPGNSGLRIAIASIASNDINEDPYTFVVKGTGLDATVGVSVNPLEADEDSGTGFVFTFTRVGATGSDLVVSFDVSGTGTPGVDYNLAGAINFDSVTKRGTVLIQAGNATADITVTPVSDDDVELDETVIITPVN